MPFHPPSGHPSLPSPFSIYKIRGGECSPPLPSCLAIYRCTRHRISSVNACVYLSAKIFLFFEASKHSSYFLAPQSYAVPGNARHEPKP